MDDMVPGLLKSMSDDFQSQYDSNEKIQSLNEKLNNGTATYKEANEYASEVGSITESTYETYLTSENLPDGKCYYNIASRVTSTTLHNQYELVADYTEEVQTTLNQKAGIGLKAQRADEDTESYKSLADYMSAADNYDDVAKSTAQSAARMAMSTVDNSVKKNTEFQGKSGLSPKIIRHGGSGCCEWCSGLSGTYDYPKVPSDVYARHNNCTCTVEYDPGDGRRQDVWSKQWTSEEEISEKEELKTLGLDKDSDDSKKIEYRKAVGLKEETESTFTPASTIHEAEEFIKNYVDDKQFGALGVSYDGIGVDVANKINETISSFYETYNVDKFGGVFSPRSNSALGKTISDAHAGYSKVRNSFVLNRKNLKSVNVAESSLLEEKTFVSDYLKNPQNYNKSKLSTRVLNLLENSKESGRGSVPETVEDIINHELGHSLEIKIKELDNYSEIVANMVEYSSKISGYACESVSEYIAESFCSYKKGESIIDPTLKEAFEMLERVNG